MLVYVPVWQIAYVRGPQRAVGRAAVAAMRVIVVMRIKTECDAEWGCCLLKSL